MNLNPLRHTQHWSLRTRLALVTVISLALGIVPSALLMLRMMSDEASVTREVAALPANRAWQQLLAALQTERELGVEGLSTRPDAKQEWPAARRTTTKALSALDAALQADAELPAMHAQTLRALQAQLAKLEQAADQGELDVNKLLARHQALAEEVFAGIARLNADSGLLLDGEAASYFAIVAGLQEAPRAQDALSELSAIARGAAVDDLAAVARALTRYREHARQMQSQLQVAQAAAPAEQAAVLGRLIAKTAGQSQQVEAPLEAAARDVNYPLDKLAAELKAASQQQQALSLEVLDALDTRLAARAAEARRHRLVLSLAVPLLVGLIVFIMLRSIRQLLVPVRQMVEVTERIAGGDLSEPVPQGRRDELGRVLGALGQMQGRLRQLVQRIHDDAGSIRSAAQEIASGNQDLADRTEQAAAQLQGTAAHVSGLSDAVQLNTQAAHEAAGLAQSTLSVAREGEQVVGEVVGTIGAIHDASRRIADISGLIDGIAFQTNILALNAAVEAARAGEQGRGFAVVAAEVRALAQRSATAAKEIKTLIGQTVERVEAGAQLGGQAGQAMQAIMGRVDEVSALIHRIADQARAEAGQTLQVGEAIRHIDGMTQQNAALVEQAAASAESLRQQATRMDETVQAFRLR
jgi:methyl-accepting chemotaxis protein